MNYIKLINQFWTLRRSKRITSLQADLYYFLLQECNNREWENPFECANTLIRASIGISEPSIIDARNRLKQLGLIEFEPGQRKESSPIYELLYLNNLSINRVKAEYKPSIKVNLLNKQNKTETKQSKSHCGNSPPEEKKISEREISLTTEFWEPLVNTWFDFYGQNFKNEDQSPARPYFNGQQGKQLKQIVQGLKVQTKMEWTQDHACHCLKRFLQKAITRDQWTQKNFELGTLLSKFNSITNQPNGTNLPVTGQKLNRGESAQTAVLNDLASELGMDAGGD